MSDFNKKCLNIIKDLENNIKDNEICSYVKSKIIDLMVLYNDNIDEILKKQDIMNEKINNIKDQLLNIEDEIFENNCIDEDCNCNSLEENEDYDFEITCPFCDYSFITDDCTFNQKTIKCPKCKEIIELDWSDNDDTCNDCCNNCCDHCYEDKSKESILEIKEKDEEYKKSNDGNENLNENEKKKNKNNNNKNEDDM